jgi:protein involved in sex pheromone biosynthesis
MKTKIAGLAAVLLAGCSTFVTDQLDERINQKTGEKTEIHTKVKARTFWESKSALANFKASQTEKTQGATVGSLNQEASATNAVQVLNSLKGILDSLPK